MHIPEDGAVLSWDISILRGSTCEGYPFLSPAALNAVVSVAAPNRNADVADSPVDCRRGEDYRLLLRKKFKAVLEGATRARAEVLVVPDVGCGVFQNDPVDVGHAFGMELAISCPSGLRKVILCGGPKFCSAAREAAHRYKDQAAALSALSLGCEAQDADTLELALVAAQEAGLPDTPDSALTKARKSYSQQLQHLKRKAADILK